MVDAEVRDDAVGWGGSAGQRARPASARPAAWPRCGVARGPARHQLWAQVLHRHHGQGQGLYIVIDELHLSYHVRHAITARLVMSHPKVEIVLGDVAVRAAPLDPLRQCWSMAADHFDGREAIIG